MKNNSCATFLCAKKERKTYSAIIPTYKTNAVNSKVTATIRSAEEYSNDVDALIDAQQMCEDRHIRECDIDVNVKYKTDDNETDYKRYYHYHYKDHKIES